jgi:hypothetical protein
MPQRHRDTEQKESRDFIDNLSFSVALWLCGSVAIIGGMFGD